MKNSKVIYSTDVDLFQSSFIVLENNRCFYIQEYDNNFLVYRFDLLDTIESWINLDDINSYTGGNYSNSEVIDYINLTNDVCSYYGAINLDSTPSTMNEEEFTNFIDNLQVVLN